MNDKHFLHMRGDGQSLTSKTGFWIVGKESKHHMYDDRLGAALCEFFAKEHACSVADVGCGHAMYAKAIRDVGINVFCYDGNPRIAENCGIDICVVDLSAECDLAVCDWTLCMEVGEHIPEQYESSFMRNLHRCNRRGIVLTWAIPGQGGNGHVNCRSREYIATAFGGMGYSCDDAAGARIQARAASLWWVKNSMVVLRKKRSTLTHI